MVMGKAFFTLLLKTALFNVVYQYLPNFRAEIHIPIVNDTEYEKSEDFYIELGEPVWHKNIGEDVSASAALLFHPMVCDLLLTNSFAFHFYPFICQSAIWL